MATKQRRNLLVSVIVFLVLLLGLLTWVLVADIKPRLGLDLAGGTSVVLEAKGDIKGPDVMDQVINIVRSRVDGLGVSEAEISKAGSNLISVDLPGLQDVDRAKDIIGRTAKLSFRQVQGTPGAQTSAQTAPTGVPGGAPTGGVPTGGAPTGGAPTGGVPTGGAPTGGVPTGGAPTGGVPTGGVPQPQSLAPVGAVDGRPVLARSGAAGPAFGFRDGMRAQIAPTDTPAPTETTPAEGEQPSQPSAAALCDPATNPAITPADKITPDATVTLCDKDGRPYTLGPVRVRGETVDNAQANLNQQSGEWVVQLDFNSEGAEAYKALTGEAACQPVGQPQRSIAIVLDDQVVSAPQVAQDVQCNQGLGSNSIITLGTKGTAGQQEAKDLALVLRYGSLPVDLGVATTETVSPTLGTDSLHAGLIAALVGLILVVIFVLLLYRVYGLIIVTQLLVFAACNYVFICLMGEFRGMTLSLSGIAAFAIAIGINADSAIVFIERVKDELREGRTMRTAFDRGFKRAWKTIVAGDTVSFLAAIVLYVLAIGSVRGFALTLGIAVVFDVVISWFFTRPLTLLLSGGGLFQREPSVFWRRPVDTRTAEVAA